MHLIMYSTGESFFRALAEALEKKNPNAKSDVDRLIEFVRDRTGFKITNAQLQHDSKVLLTLGVK